MNKCIISGRLTKNAVVNGGDKKALTFTLASKYGYDTKANEGKGADRVEFVPCVLFTEPNDKLGIFLAGEGKGIFVEFEGRFSTSKYEKDGETKYNSEVIIDKRTFNIITNPKSDTR